jgi:4-diphosphocytidyl-2-C-methyl-D-erythritol kinase
VLLIPPMRLEGKTARLYSLLDEGPFTDGRITRRLVEGIRRGDFSGDMLFNAFEQVMGVAFPGIEGYWRAFLAAGAPFVHLTGTGPALFTMVESRERGEELYRALRGRGLEAYLARTVGDVAGLDALGGHL